jgi:excisionase family DNA binding protein
MDRETLGSKELAAFLGVSQAFALDLMRQPGFPSVRLGRIYRVRREDFDRWWSEHAGTGIRVTTSRTGLGRRAQRAAAPRRLGPFPRAHTPQPDPTLPHEEVRAD